MNTFPKRRRDSSVGVVDGQGTISGTIMPNMTPVRKGKCQLFSCVAPFYFLIDREIEETSWRSQMRLLVRVRRLLSFARAISERTENTPGDLAGNPANVGICPTFLTLSRLRAFSLLYPSLIISFDTESRWN